jgi:hypothetical protein
MPTISAESIAAERRRINRALALSRRKGDFITCDCMPSSSPAPSRPLSKAGHEYGSLEDFRDLNWRLGG